MDRTRNIYIVHKHRSTPPVSNRRIAAIDTAAAEDIKHIF